MIKNVYEQRIAQFLKKTMDVNYEISSSDDDNLL